MKKALIVVDYQNDFVDGALGFLGAEGYHDIICQKIQEYKANGQVIFTLDTHDTGYLETEEGRNLPVPHCIKGTKGHTLYGKVAALAEGCIQIEKHTFGSDKLGDILQKGAYTHVELCGLVSNICVLSNAVIAKAYLPNAVVMVDRCATGSGNPQLDQKTFDILAGIHIKII